MILTYIIIFFCSFSYLNCEEDNYITTEKVDYCGTLSCVYHSILFYFYGIDEDYNNTVNDLNNKFLYYAMIIGVVFALLMLKRIFGFGASIKIGRNLNKTKKKK